MTNVLAIPMGLRLGGLMLLGVLVGRVVNWAVLQLRLSAWPIEGAVLTETRHGPWRCLPIVGWIGARVELPDGSRQWLRPLMVELLCGLGFAGLYWWEIGRVALLTDVPPPATAMADSVRAALQPMFAAHLLLGFLMLVASLIDLDERIIPDCLTLPGTLAGLLLAAWTESVMLPTEIVGGVVPTVVPLHIASPRAWPASLGGFPHAGALAIGLACYLGWCFALLPRRWYGRRGWLYAGRHLVARVLREPVSKRIAVMATIGAVVITALWFRNGASWRGLLTALVGMAAGGGLVWSVRLIGAAALRREAMGFGDVTLMAMIGTLVGWQNGLIIFFAAPLLGLVLGLLQWVLRRESEIPYGPFLCLATVVVILDWRQVWLSASPYFAIEWLIPTVVMMCLALMAVLLVAMRAARAVFFGSG